MADNEQMQYDDRDMLDAELASAINDIRSAEAEAKLIVEKAESSVKAVQLDGAARERAFREQNGQAINSARERAMSEALEKAKAERADRLKKAENESEKLVSSKRDRIDARIAELYATLAGESKQTAKTQKQPRKPRTKKA